MSAELGTPETPSLAFLELSSIARGLYLTDVVLKKAPVRVLCSQPISSGKHVVLWIGDVASVQEAFDAACASAEGTLLRNVLIAGVHPALAPHLTRSAFAPFAEFVAVDDLAAESLAVCESATVAGAILAADRALKVADVRLSRMRLGQGIGGKAYFVLAGALDDVQAASDAGRDCLAGLESLARVDVIARPEPEAAAFF